MLFRLKLLVTYSFLLVKILLVILLFYPLVIFTLPVWIVSGNNSLLLWFELCEKIQDEFESVMFKKY
jgi:hypothetical protein